MSCHRKVALLEVFEDLLFLGERGNQHGVANFYVHFAKEV